MITRPFPVNFRLLFQEFSEQLAEEARKKNYVVEVIDLKTYEPEDDLAEQVSLSYYLSIYSFSIQQTLRHNITTERIVFLL